MAAWPWQAGQAQAHVEAPCVAVGKFAIEQQRQPLGVPKFGGLGLALQLDESLGHAVKLQRFELIERWMYQHRVLLSGSNAGRGCWNAQSPARPRRAWAV
jgi:hypothetical protein